MIRIVIRSPWRRGAWFLVVALTLPACQGLADAPPAPDRPRLTAVAIEPAVVTSRCPASVTFRFEDPHGDVVAARAYWKQQRGPRSSLSGTTPLAIDPADLSGQRRGVATATLALRTVGSYELLIQIEDARGLSSNLVEGALTVNQPALWGQAPCR